MLTKLCLAWYSKCHLFGQHSFRLGAPSGGGWDFLQYCKHMEYGKPSPYYNIFLKYCMVKKLQYHREKILYGKHFL